MLYAARHEDRARPVRRRARSQATLDAGGVWCRDCGRPVEKDRECYARPTCYACLAPPERARSGQCTARKGGSRCHKLGHREHREHHDIVMGVRWTDDDGTQS